MAPRVKFTRDEMVQAALSVVKAKGISALTARAIADELGVSTQPVFTCFNTMEEAKREVRAAVPHPDTRRQKRRDRVNDPFLRAADGADKADI